MLNLNIKFLYIIFLLDPRMMVPRNYFNLLFMGLILYLKCGYDVESFLIFVFFLFLTSFSNFLSK